jgi:hypothetical protein
MINQELADRKAKYRAEVEASLKATSGLTDKQIAVALEIAVAHEESHSGQQPNLAGIVAHVKKQK